MIQIILFQPVVLGSVGNTLLKKVNKVKAKQILSFHCIIQLKIRYAET